MRISSIGQMGLLLLHNRINGYSLSCGGPIVVPGTENFIISPIAPQPQCRPVVSEDREIILRVEDRDELALVALF